MTDADKEVIKSTWLWLKYTMIPMTLIWIAYHEVLFEWVANHYYIVFVALAAALNACMDVVSFHFTTSVFRNLKSSFYNPEYSWMNKYKRMGNNSIDLDKRRMLFWKIPYPVQLSDLWHLCKTLMIISIVLAIVTYREDMMWIDFLFIGYFCNIFFSLFYDIILRKK